MAVQSGRSEIDPRGSDLKRGAEPVFTAIEAYERDFGALPVTLEALVPRYLAAREGVASLEYSVERLSVTIAYTPTWPSTGRVSCTRQIKTSSWQCHGYF